MVMGLHHVVKQTVSIGSNMRGCRGMGAVNPDKLRKKKAQLPQDMPKIFPPATKIKDGVRAL